MNDQILTTAIEAALEAGVLLKKAFSRKLIPEEKADGSLVSEFDRKSEELIIALIQERFPDHSIVAEETGVIARNPKFTWYIDPLDGTRNFLNHIPFFCVSIGYVERSEVIAGVIYDPIHDERFYAKKGFGAFLNAKRLLPIAPPRLTRTIIGTSRGRNEEQKRIHNCIVEELELISGGVRRFGSAALILAYLAAGRLGGVIDYGSKPYDVAAGLALAGEVGAEILNFRGARASIHDDNLVIAHPTLVNNLLSVAQRHVS